MADDAVRIPEVARILGLDGVEVYGMIDRGETLGRIAVELGADLRYL